MPKSKDEWWKSVLLAFALEQGYQMLNSYLQSNHTTKTPDINSIGRFAYLNIMNVFDKKEYT